MNLKKLTVVVVLAIPLLFAALWVWSSKAPLTEAQLDALALMTEQDKPTGRNAYPALWTMPWDVPEDEQAMIVAKDADYWHELSFEEWTEGTQKQAPRVSHAEGRYPSLDVSAAERPLLCMSGDRESCLQRVRADRSAYTELVEGNRRLFDRLAALSKYDHYRTELPLKIHSPTPSFHLPGYLRTRHAVWFVEGDRDAALDGVCTDIATWRRLGSNSDQLITRLIGVAYSSGANARMLAEMLAEIQPDHPLPSSCQLLRDPPAVDELSMCNVMRGEHRFAADSMTGMLDFMSEGNWYQRLTSSLLFDPERTVAQNVTAYAGFCEDAHRQRLAMDERPVMDTESETAQDTIWRRECLSNWYGCVGLNGGIYSDFEARIQDHGARLRLLGALLWLRDQHEDPRPLAEVLNDLPDQFTSPARRPLLGDSGSSLRVRQFDDRNGEYWEVPLAVKGRASL